MMPTSRTPIWRGRLGARLTGFSSYFSRKDERPEPANCPLSWSDRPPIDVADTMRGPRLWTALLANVSNDDARRSDGTLGRPGIDHYNFELNERRSG
jgi:hypothetical protein